jgi:hypothetical protein
VKVVEGSEIYNFSVHTLVHFYFKIGRKSQTNKGTVKRLAPERDVTPRRPRRAPPLRRPGRARTFPRRARLPQDTRAPRRVGIRPAARHAGRTPWTAGPLTVPVRARLPRQSRALIGPRQPQD